MGDPDGFLTVVEASESACVRIWVHGFLQLQQSFLEACQSLVGFPVGRNFACMAMASGQWVTAHWDACNAVSLLLACQFWPHSYLVHPCKQ